SSSITFWVTLEVLPLPSLKVQVITVVPCVVIGKLVDVVAVTVPTQLSVAVGAVGDAEHSAVTSGNEAGAAGGVISSSITFWVTLEVLPLPSLKVQVITVVPCVVIGKLVDVVAVITAPAQPSMAVGAVILFTEHSAVTSGNEAGAAGGVISSSITFW